MGHRWTKRVAQLQQQNPRLQRYVCVCVRVSEAYTWYSKCLTTSVYFKRTYISVCIRMCIRCYHTVELRETFLIKFKVFVYFFFPHECKKQWTHSFTYGLEFHTNTSVHAQSYTGTIYEKSNALNLERNYQ